MKKKKTKRNENEKGSDHLPDKFPRPFPWDENAKASAAVVIKYY
jgi:hypothetical protein